ncbi:MAG: hypothetical protein HIU92_20775 [Proteobacteria bacterium]|nr:hypothetical protein [Pseudomonadota bacterium]
MRRDKAVTPLSREKSVDLFHFREKAVQRANGIATPGGLDTTTKQRRQRDET